jgi:3-carboxy-cis,cis-muconate cycloisomerase
MAVERVAGELYRLMGEEVGEIEERLEEGTVGSSTMPHKVNPKYVVRILAQCAKLRSLAVPALESGLSKHEGDAVANHLLSTVTDRAVPLAWRLAEGFADLLDRIRPVPERMAQNLALTDGGIAAERLMMQLAPKVGRARAHDIVHHALDAGLTAGLSPREALLADGEMAGLMRTEDIAAALDPSGYAGDSAEIARVAARLAEALAARLRSG